jgi:hypothetical protein
LVHVWIDQAWAVCLLERTSEEARVMHRRRILILISLAMVAIALFWGSGGADVPRTINY